MTSLRSIPLFRTLGLAAAAAWLGALAPAGAASAQVSVAQVQGAGPYDPVTVELQGPMLDEASGPNPFADYRLDVTFSDGRNAWTAPGYFAGCADAADRPCTRGRLWRTHFVPSHGGKWTYSVRFRTGRDVVVSGEGQAAPGDGATGAFSVGETPRNPIRARGLLTYTGEHYYRWSGTQKIFFKLGLDAPENMLAYADFDATPNAKNLRKTWEPHLRDFDARGGAGYTWAGGKGRALLGMLRYVEDAGLNSVSMLLFNVGGDDRNVIPQLLRVTPEAYAAMEPRAQWDQGVVHDRYDVSKLAQWQRALSYADSLGIHLHFKLQENENDRFMDGGELGRERMIYFREMAARFNHFLAVTWNLGEENIQPAAAVAAESYYLASLDPYRHPLVLHTFPDQKERYRAMLGHGSALNGLSLQGLFADFRDVRGDVTKWLGESRKAGRPWVVANDEQGVAQYGAPVDADYPADRLPEPRRADISAAQYRRDGIWNTLTAGGNGVEAYYGYLSGCSDLTCQDHRTRASLWRDGAAALRFFERHVGDAAATMKADDDLTPNSDDYVFAEIGRRYLIYYTLPPEGAPRDNAGRAPTGGQRRLQLYGQNGAYSVAWYDARRAGNLQRGSVQEVTGGGVVNLGDPPSGGSGEWAILVERKN